METYLLQQQRSVLETVVKKAVKETFTELSLLTDDLLTTAEKNTKTREEYVAFLKGAAFIFYKVCKRDDKQPSGQSSPIESPDDAIEHIVELFPFLTEDEKSEHLKLVNWLNDLLEKSGKPKVELPKYIKDYECLATNR